MYRKNGCGLFGNLLLDFFRVKRIVVRPDIGWGLDYSSLAREGIRERSNKQYLNDYFQGYVGDSTSRGELYNADPVTGDAR